MPKIEGACPDARSDATIRPWQRALQVRRPPSKVLPPSRHPVEESPQVALMRPSPRRWPTYQPNNVGACIAIDPTLDLFRHGRNPVPSHGQETNASDGALKTRHLPLSSTGVSQASYPVPLMERSWAIYMPLYSPYQQACSRTLLNKISLASCDTFSTWKVHPPRLVEVKSRCTSQLADGGVFSSPTPPTHRPWVGDRTRLFLPASSTKMFILLPRVAMQAVLF
jgi:hypothetical protein